MAEQKSPDPLRRTRRWAVLWTAMAVMSGLVATFLVARTLRNKVAQQPRVETVPLVVAKVEIPMGATIGQEHLRIAEWPKDLVPAGGFQTIEQVKNRVAKEDLVVDEPILDRRLTSTELGTGITALIPENMRAMALKVDEVIGVAGFIRANDWVDVIAVMQPRNGTAQRDVRARIAVPRVKVLAVGQEMVEPSQKNKPKTAAVVTLLLAPEQAEALALAMTEGQVRLALRGPVDEEVIDTEGLEPSDLVGPDAPPPVVVAASGAAPKPRAKQAAKKPEVAAVPASSVVEIFSGRKLEERKIRPASEIIVDKN